MMRCWKVVAAALLFSGISYALAQPPPDDCLRSLDSGRVFLQQRNYAAASLQFHAALACPNNRNALFGLAQSRLLEEKFPESLDALRSLLSADPHDVAALRLKAQAHYLSGQDIEAEKTLLQALAIDSRDQEAIYSLGRVYYTATRYQDALAQFRRLIELNPKSYKGYDNLGLCYEALADDRHAIASYMKALDLVYKDHPHYDWPYANLANLLIKLGSYEKAFDLAVEAASRNPYSARNCYLTGKALFELDKAELSVRWLKRSIELDAAYPQPRYLLAQIYKKQGLTAEAEREFRAFRDNAAKAPRNPR